MEASGGADNAANQLAAVLGQTSAMPMQSAVGQVQMMSGAEQQLAMQQTALQHAAAQQMAMMASGQLGMMPGMIPGAFGGMMPGVIMPQMPGLAGLGMPSVPSMPSLTGLPAADPSLAFAALSATGPEGVMAASALAANPLSFQMPFAGLPVAGVGPVTGLGSVAPRAPRRNTIAQRRANEAKAASTGPLPKLSLEELEDPVALINAANRGDELRCRAILKHNDYIGINEKGDDGRSALLVATLRKLPEDLCLEILRHPHFKEVNAVDRWGNSALINAASKGLGTLCEAVLDRGEFTSVNCKDKWGATALHWAADMNLGGVCEKLLAHPDFIEANMVAFSFCFENKTALQVAEGRGNTLAAEVIRKHLGK